ncbi:hypothetical protein BJX64DRAFT_288916 [Aspergillus heterothallicus]
MDEPQQTRYPDPESANERPDDPTIQFRFVDDIDEHGNPPLNPTLLDPLHDNRTVVQIITTRLHDEEPHHWVVLLQPYPTTGPDTVCIWYHIFRDKVLGYTSLIERATCHESIVRHDWRSAEYVTWISTTRHGQMIEALDRALDSEPVERWIRVFLREIVHRGLVSLEKAAELEWVVLPGVDEPGDNEVFPDSVKTDVIIVDKY